MNNEKDEDLYLNYIQNNSIDSIEDDFMTSGKYLTYNSNTNKLGIIDMKVNITKKDTKMSSNDEKDGESDNNIKENKSTNILDLHIPLSDNNLEAKKSRNYNNEEKLNFPNSVINMSNPNFNSNEDINNNLNKLTDYENNESRKRKNNEILLLKVTEESINSNEKRKNKQLNEISKGKKKRKKLLLFEEKNKYKTSKKHLYEVEEQKKEEIILRKDKNGVPICKKNKKKVKINFKRPFENIIPVESYKKYNELVGMPKFDNLVGSKNIECQCCSLF